MGVIFGSLLFALCSLLRAGAGTRPGGRGTFLCFAKEKYPKEKRPHDCDPSAQRWGTPAPGHLRGAPWNSLRACGAALGQPRRVSPRCGCVLRHTRHPASTPAQAQSQGIETPQNIHTGHCCAWPGWHRRCAPSGIWHVACGMWHVACGMWHVACGVWRLAFGVWRLAFAVCRLPFAVCRLPFAVCRLPRGCWAKRSDGPYGCSAVLASTAPSGRAEKRSAGRIRAARCLSRRRVCAAPARREHRRLPRCAAAGSRTAGSPFLCLLSFGEAKESEAPAGASPGSHTQQNHTHNKKPALTPVSSGNFAINSRATSARPAGATALLDHQSLPGKATSLLLELRSDRKIEPAISDAVTSSA
ncbi:hypothetical protein EV674_1184 [Simplicispira metamorpha]|uniref:Uncharacterized protein n=1 Tax=Simplicispira metamorpha TaxID=80881 RepID=A0A4R2N643_9BURK|nr:hypothetical protein EV674_1184 [Simplicispira metamorpha]